MKIKFHLRQKAGALQFVLFIGVVIMLILFTFIILNNTHSFFNKKTIKLVDTIKKADLGLQYSMQAQLRLKDSITLPLNFDDDIIVKCIKDYWGIFEKYTIVSNFKKNKIVKTALVGGYESNRTALYLQDVNYPMIIVGKSRINGNAYIPRQGIRPGTISGQPYINKKLLYGNKWKSTSELPKLDSSLRIHIDQLVRPFKFNPLITNTSIFPGAILKNSFKVTPIHIEGDVIDLTGVTLIGHIIVKAARRIIVDSSTQLKDVMLLAPQIIIGNRVKGSFQAIASKEIFVGKFCELQYPSTLVIYKKENSRKSDHDKIMSNITIDNYSTIKGVIMYLGETKDQILQPQILIQEHGLIIGEIFCEQNLELKGEVWGTVSTRLFVALVNGNIYQNHLFNGSINSNLLPFQYSGIIYENRMFLNTQKTLVQWLY